MNKESSWACPEERQQQDIGGHVTEVSYSYTATGRVESISHSDNPYSLDAYTVNYQYNELGQIKNVKDDNSHYYLGSSPTAWMFYDSVIYSDGSFRFGISKGVGPDVEAHKKVKHPMIIFVLFL